MEINSPTKPCVVEDVKTPRTNVDRGRGGFSVSEVLGHERAQARERAYLDL